MWFVVSGKILVYWLEPVVEEDLRRMRVEEQSFAGRKGSHLWKSKVGVVLSVLWDEAHEVGN